jgi:hypothetical protein
MTATEAGKRGSGEAGKQSDVWQCTARMNRCLRVGVILLASASQLPRFPAAPLHAQATSLTIYNDGRVLMRRTIPAAIPKGSSVQRLTMGALDPATVFSLDSSVTLMGVSYDGAVDEGSALRRSVGKRLVFRLPPGPAGSADTISALVLGVDPLRLQLRDGRISFTQPGIPLYPPDVVVAEPTANLSVRSAQGLDKLWLGYFTGGASWQASYQVVLGRSDARVSGMAVLASQSLRAEDAEIHLLAGEVSRAQPKTPPQPLMREMRMEAADAMRVDQFAGEQRLGEFHLYSLAGRTTLLPGLTTSVALFQPSQVKYDKNYIVHGDVPSWGFLPQHGEETQPPVEVEYTLTRPRKSDFGDRPVPGGIARLYEADTGGGLQLVGEATIDHTPAGNDLKLNAGTAFDITARRIQTSYVTRRDSTATRGVHTVATADYRVTLKNATDTAVTVLVQEERMGEWSVVSSSLPREKVSSTITRFRVPVPATGEAVLRYRIRVIW